MSERGKDKFVGDPDDLKRVKPGEPIPRPGTLPWESDNTESADE